MGPSISRLPNLRKALLCVEILRRDGRPNVDEHLHRQHTLDVESLLRRDIADPQPFRTQIQNSYRVSPDSDVDAEDGGVPYI